MSSTKSIFYSFQNQSYTDNRMVGTREEGVGGQRVKGVTYKVTDGAVTLGGGHTGVQMSCCKAVLEPSRCRSWRESSGV